MLIVYHVTALQLMIYSCHKIMAITVLCMDGIPQCEVKCIVNPLIFYVFQ